MIGSTGSGRLLGQGRLRRYSSSGRLSLVRIGGLSQLIVHATCPQFEAGGRSQGGTVEAQHGSDVLQPSGQLAAIGAQVGGSHGRRHCDRHRGDVVGERERDILETAYGCRVSVVPPVVLVGRGKRGAGEDELCFGYLIVDSTQQSDGGFALL